MFAAKISHRPQVRFFGKTLIVPVFTTCIIETEIAFYPSSERKKLLRIIKRAQSSIKSNEADQKDKEKLDVELFEARVMLNYILHYP